MKVKNMVIIAIFAALSIVFSTLKVFQMPNGGSITLYLVPLMFVALKLDFKSALLCSFIVSIIQIIMSGYVIGFFQVFLDYILPVCLISLFNFAKDKPLPILLLHSSYIGALMLGCYVVSGMVYWKVDFIGSVVYNATFFIPTYVISMILIIIVNKVMVNIDSR